MIGSYDVGSLPFDEEAKLNLFLEGASSYLFKPEEKSAVFFEKKVFQAFLDKANAGIEVPNYPQFRDMNSMFLSMIDGIEKIKEGYVEFEKLSLKRDKGNGIIAEVEVIRRKAKELSAELGVPLKIKVCITGPYTLSSLFLYKNGETFLNLAEVLAKIVEINTFNNKHCRTEIVSLDEPTFGFIDDPLLDYGSPGREKLLKAWDKIFHTARVKGAKTCIHLHNTSDSLFWEVGSLQILESHVNDNLYKEKTVKKKLEEKDKFLKASICITDFDQLIRIHTKTHSTENLTQLDLNKYVAEAWKNIRSGKLDPTIFLEETETMRKRLKTIVQLFGAEKVLYAGPECGLRSFPSYNCAIECLRRTVNVVKTI